MSKNIAVIIGTTRPSRIGANVTNWVISRLPVKDGIVYEIIDLAEWNLPIFDEAKSPMMGQYQNDHTKKWSAKISEFDGFVIVSAEYNAGYPAALKNAVDYLAAEWKDKPIAIVTYGYTGGASANNQLDEVFTRLKMKVTPTKPKLFFSEGIFGEDGQIKDIEEAFGKHAADIAKAGEELIS